MGELNDLIIKSKADFKKTHRIGNKVYELTPGIAEDKEWMKLTDVPKALNLKIDQVNKLSSERELNWPKKYDMDGHKMACFVPKQKIIEYLQKKNFYTITDADTTNNPKDHGGAAQEQHETKPSGNEQYSSEGAGEEGQSLTLLNSKIFEQKVSEVFRNVMKDELNQIKEELIKTVKDSESKSSKPMVIIGGISFVVLCIGASLYFHLNNRFLELTNQLMDEKEKYYQVNSTLQAKDVEIKFLRGKESNPIAAPLTNTQAVSNEVKKD